MHVGYSLAMTNERTAPDISPGYPSRGAVLGPAWELLWAELTAADDYLDGLKLALSVSERTEARPATLVALLSRAARAEVLDRETRPVRVSINRGEAPPGKVTRTRTFYRISELGRIKAERVLS